MSQDEVEQILPGWQAASQTVAQELAEWRRAHPKATLTEIEGAVFGADAARGDETQQDCDDGHAPVRHTLRTSRPFGDTKAFP